MVSFTLAPNPAQTEIQVIGSFTITSLEVTDLTGNVYTVPQNGTLLDVQALSPGIYFVRVTDLYGETGVARFVKE